jgi:hypothetical protein
MLIVNATPHDVVVIVNGDRRVFAKGDTLARVATHNVEIGTLMGIPVSTQQIGSLVGLDDETVGVYYIVSSLCLEAGKLEGRGDLLAPTGVIRDEKGVIIGCSGFTSSAKGLSAEDKYDAEIGVEHVGDRFKKSGYDLVKLVSDDHDVLLSMYHSAKDVKIDIILEIGIDICVNIVVTHHDEVKHFSNIKTKDIYNDVMYSLSAWL